MGEKVKAGYTDEELRSYPSTWGGYTTAIRLLVCSAVMKSEETSPEMKAEATQEARELSKGFYAPRVGDQIIWELFSNGMRYRCTIREVRADGWAFDTGDGASFHPKFGFIVSTERPKK